MTTNITPAFPTEPVEPVQEPVQPEPKTEPKAETPASEPVEEPFDKERAMSTIKAQRAKEKELQAQLKDYERLKAEEEKRLEAQMTEAEKLKKQADELAKQNAQLQDSILRRDVIAESGLPAMFADRLKGETKEAMLEDALKLKELLPQTQTKTPKISTTNPDGANPNETEAQKRERLFGTNINIFDPKTIEAMGGGVVWDTKKE